MPTLPRDLEKEIYSVKTSVESVIDKLLDIIDDQEKEIDNLYNRIQELEETLSTLN